MFVNVFTAAPVHNLSMIRRRFFTAYIVLALLLVAFPAAAASTVDCHCFRDREFSPQNPAAYDPYLLATVQNRLMAYAFDVPRKEIVSLKMTGGAQGESLWIAYWVAKASSRPVSEVRDLYSRTSSWEKTVAGLAIKPETLGTAFHANLAEGDDTSLAWDVVEQVSEKFSTHPDAYADLKQRGASLKQAILACVLAELKEIPAVTLYNQAMQQGAWGSLLSSSNLAVESIESFLKTSFTGQ